MRQDPEFEPQPCQLRKRAHHAAEVEELALSVCAEVVMHWHFHHVEAALFHTRHHLNSDAAAAAFQRKALENVAPEQAKVAVHIAQVQSEPPFHKMVIHAADDFAMQWVM